MKNEMRRELKPRHRKFLYIQKFYLSLNYIIPNKNIHFQRQWVVAFLIPFSENYKLSFENFRLKTNTIFIFRNAVYRQRGQ